MSSDVGEPPLSTDLPWTAVPAKVPDLVTRTIADETVVVPLRGRLAQLQNIYVLSTVGAHLWVRIDGVADMAALHASILESYEVDPDQARADLLEFVQSMLTAGLLELVGQPVARSL